MPGKPISGAPIGGAVFAAGAGRTARVLTAAHVLAPVEARTALAPLHLERLELLRDILLCALELEAPCDFAAAPGGRALNERIFFAHFESWRELLREWDELQIRSRGAPGRLWAAAAGACERHGLQEPPVALGSVTDKLAILTLARARDWQLDTPHELSMQLVEDRISGVEYLTLYLERERIASLPGARSADSLQAIARSLQATFNELQGTAEAHAISATRDSLLELKHELLSRGASLRAEAAAPAADCPLCEDASVGSAPSGAGA